MKNSAKRVTTPSAALAKRQVRISVFALLAAFGISCSNPQYSRDFDFGATWGHVVIGCEGIELKLTDLRFFVSDVVLLDPNGREFPFVLTPDQQWQQFTVALIDLENGQGTCTNGTSQENSTLRGTSAIEYPAAMRFTIGVPFVLNHANPLQAEPPLDNAAMHWHWRSGYKFMRAGIAVPNDGFRTHLGSTACNGTVQAIEGCDAPNRVTVELDNLVPGSNRIAVDLSVLFDGIDLDNESRGDCSSGPAEDACAAVFSNLGLPFRDIEPVALPVFRLWQ